VIGNDIVIKNACVITGTGRVYPDGFIHIKGSKIIGLGGSSAPGASTVIDAHGAYVLPGFVNSHTHLYSGLARGIEVGRMRKFGEVLKGLWWKLDRALTLEDIYVSAMIGGIEAVKAGVTTVFDHHASYGAISGSLGAVSEALSAIGLRASTCFELSDRCGLSARDEAVAETGLYLESLKNQSIEDPEFLFRGMVGLHASMTLSDDTLNDARELMDIFGVGAHVHVAEGLEDVVATKKKFRMTPVERFVRAGILRKGSLAVHCVHVTKNDIATLKKCGVTVVHNPLSNLNNAVGVSPVLAMAKRGVPFIIGTDGMSLGVADDLKLASVLHKSAACDAQAAWSEMRDAVWQTAPAFVSKMFGYEVGVLKKGAAADIVIIDCSPPTPVTKDNAFGHFMFGVLNSRVRTTIVAGKILMRDFEVMGVDEAVLAKVARALAKKLWQRI
jgi:putative selenium metabolism protein SsnA